MRKWIFFSAIALVVTAQSISVAASNTEWDRTVLPRPPQAFEGVTKRTLEGSVGAFPQPVTAPKDAPNILLVLIDDAGFGNPSTFGGPVATPTLNKLADAGLRYNRFHVTALCSPTRAALLAGRNHHMVGIRFDLGVDGRLARATARSGRRARPPSRRFCEAMVIALPRSASGTSRPTINRDRQGLLTAGRTGSASTISGDFSAAKTASSIRS